MPAGEIGGTLNQKRECAIPQKRDAKIPIMPKGRLFDMNERSFIFPAYVTTPDRLFQCRSAFPDP